MTQPDIEWLRELLANATPGPWKAVRHTVIDRSVLMSFLRRTPDITIGSGSEGDAPLIAEARNALPGLIDTIEALAAKLEAALSALAHFNISIRPELPDDALIDSIAFTAADFRRVAAVFAIEEPD